MKQHLAIIVAAVLGMSVLPALAHEDEHQEQGMAMMEGSAMPMKKHHAAAMPSMGKMQGGHPPKDARDPHAYSDGLDFSSIPRPRFADELSFASLLVNRFEAVRNSDSTSGTFDLQGWYGRDYNRAVIKSEGDYDGGEIEEAATELLWAHAVAAYWDTQLGLRYDSGGGDRKWLALGIQGLAPYWFEVDLTGYLGEGARTAINLELEYELLFTQRLILQPRIEMDLFGSDDKRKGIGSGLSALDAGLRLRYELRREFAPYIGISWAGKFGDTQDYARAAGIDTRGLRAVAGVRFWF
ncbi:MAG: copper resistance protein B [Gammaproteobacteria bacterium]